MLQWRSAIVSARGYFSLVSSHPRLSVFIGGQSLMCRPKRIPLRTITGRSTPIGRNHGFDKLAASFEPAWRAWYNHPMRKAFLLALALASLAFADSLPKV